MNKKSACLILCALAILSAAGCSPAGHAPSQPDRIYAEGSIDQPGAGMIHSQDSYNATEDVSWPDELVFLPDTPSYRGNVTAISQKDGVYELRLEQAEGADYGYQSIMLHTSGKTYDGIDFSDVAPGDYLEVFYSDRNNGLPPIVEAANKLPPASDCIFNGVLELWQGESEGTLRLKEPDTDRQAVFRYNESTRLFVDIQDLAPGDMLSILHSGGMTKSIPPQGFALEIRRNDYGG